MIAGDPTLPPAYGPFGPISRTKLDGDAPCVRWLLSDGRGTTSGSADDAGNIQIQHFDAFGVALETAVISTCPMPNCQTCERGRRATGELGYHGQEGYKTRHYDAYRAEDLPNKSPDHPDYDENYPEGYETPSTGFIQVGARDYDPTIGRWLEVDPEPTGPELQWGQLNRWAYCADDPVNCSDPSGAYRQLIGVGLLLLGAGLTIAGLMMPAGNAATTFQILGVVVGLVGTLLLLGTAGAQAYAQLLMLVGNIAPALFRTLAFMIAWLASMFGDFAMSACLRSQISQINSAGAFVSFVRGLFAINYPSSRDEPTAEGATLVTWTARPSALARAHAVSLFQQLPAMQACVL